MSWPSPPGRRKETAAAPRIPELERVLTQALQAKVGSAAACTFSAPRNRAPQLLHHGALGTAKLGPPPLRLTDDVKFDLGALTATLCTTTLAAVLVGRHRLELSRTLAQLAPNDPPLRDGPWGALTLESLLDHTSGLPEADGAFAAALAPQLAVGATPVRSAAEQLRTPAPSSRRRDAREVQRLGGPLNAEATAQLRTTLLHTPPSARPGERQRYSALNALALGFVLEAVLEAPLDVAFRTWVVEALQLPGAAHFVRCGPDGPWAAPRDPLGQSSFAAGPRCPYRRRVVHGEPACPVAFYLGGGGGHAGLFADTRAVHAILSAHLAALEGRGTWLSAGVVQRFWTRSKKTSDATWALGWQQVCRDNGMAPGRWNARSVGASTPGAAAFVDPSFGVVGALLCNVGQAPDAAAAAGWDRMRRQAFDLMASFGQYAQGPAAPPRPRATR